MIKLKLIQYFNFSVRTQNKGASIKVPIIGGVEISNIYEAEGWMDDILILLARKITSGTFIDVGVNIGQTLIKVKNSFNSSINYLGFEPNPNCVNYCYKLIAKKK